MADYSALRSTRACCCAKAAARGRKLVLERTKAVLAQWRLKAIAHWRYGAYYRSGCCED
jgi:hypothetical protein